MLGSGIGIIIHDDMWIIRVFTIISNHKTTNIETNACPGRGGGEEDRGPAG